MQRLLTRSVYRVSRREISFSFLNKDNSTTLVEAQEGETILDIAKRYEVDLEGACEASCACSTCHVILDHGLFDDIKPAEDEEEDMLDLAFALTETSRLGCQMKADHRWEGQLVKLPKSTRNMYVDK